MSITLQKVEIEGHTVQLFQDTEGGHITGYSFSMDRYYPDPLDQLPDDFEPVRMSKTKEEIEQEIADIEECPTLALPDRKLIRPVLKRFGIKTGLSEVDGETITTIHFPYKKQGVVTGYKTKLIKPKNFWSVGETRDCDLFGWEEAVQSGAYRLFITEGELDVPATYQMLKDKNKGTKWEKDQHAVISVPNGAGAAKTAIAKNAAVISKHFKEVILVFDMDKAGQKAAEDVVKILPHAKVASLPEKDANECLIKGRRKAFCNAILFNAARPKNTRLVKGGSLREAARKKAEWGLSYPWEGLTDLTRGRRRGETIYWGAGVGVVSPIK